MITQYSMDSFYSVGSVGNDNNNDNNFNKNNNNKPLLIENIIDKTNNYLAKY